MSTQLTDPGNRRILVVRRDNIGDLLCTTPLLQAIRSQYPAAYLAVLASSYNVDVIEGNPDVDAVYVFPKRQQGWGLLRTLFLRLKLLREIRRQKFDDVILANGGWRYARHLGGMRMIGFKERDNPPHRQPDVVVPLEDPEHLHEVQKLEHLAKVLGIPEAHGHLVLKPSPEATSAAQNLLSTLGMRLDKPVLALHLSSRRPQQRWPKNAFVDLMRKVNSIFPDIQFMLLWSPGRADDPLHPGDDDKAAAIVAAANGLPIFPCPTRRVRELAAAMSHAHGVVCSDGGALHVAAGLGKPTVCFFGDSHAAEWHPWGVPYTLLQPRSRTVADITVDEAFTAVEALLRGIGVTTDRNESRQQGQRNVG